MCVCEHCSVNHSQILKYLIGMEILKHYFVDCISSPEDTLSENLQILHDRLHRTNVSIVQSDLIFFLILIIDNQNYSSFDLH